MLTNKDIYYVHIYSNVVALLFSHEIVLFFYNKSALVAAAAEKSASQNVASK